MSNTLWSLLIVAILISLAVLARFMNRDASRVLVWHNIVWIITLGLFGSNLIAYNEASPTAWLVLLCGLLAFNVASIVALAPLSDLNAPAPATYEPRPLISRSFLTFACIVYYVSFAVYLYNIARYYGLGTLLNDPGSLRSMSLDGESYLSRTPLIARLGLNLGPVLLVIFAVRESVSVPLRPLLRIVMIATIALSMLAMLQRTNFFMAVLWYFAYLIARDHLPSGVQRMQSVKEQEAAREASRRRRLLGLALVAGPLILLAAFQLLGGALGKTGQQALSTGRVSSGLAASGLSDVYVYATSGIPAFLKLVDSQNSQSPPERIPGTMVVGDYNPQTFGAASFEPIVSLIPGIQEWNSVAPFMDVGILTNVFTWYELPYRDFRLVGVVLYGFAMGYLSTRLFTRRFRDARMFWIQSAFFSTVFLSIFVAKTSTAIFWVGILFVVISTSLTGKIGPGKQVGALS